MKNLSLRQQAASSTSISKQMPDTQSDAKAKPGKRRFKGKIVKAVSDAVKLAQDMGSNIAESSVLKKPLKQYRAAGEQGLKLFANKSYLDPEAADDIYKKKITDFRRAYEKALNVYVQQKDPRHYSFLKGYLENNPKAFVFELQESPDGTTSVTVTKMRKTFTGFAEEIACLLKGHGSGGNLAKALIDSLEPLGLSLSSAIIGSSWSVHMKVPEVDDSQVQPETADDTDSLPSVSPFQRSDSKEQLRLKELEEKRIKRRKNYNKLWRPV
ncbi:hypothetical protein, partial [Endozoicomonas sp. ONNA2]|uniref:hypothetical protein n=1 Tax=Endozoicomonas sp. ONNA2 TaxID=2828741 RepID=UPI0021490BED